jgi:hypothetical protein
VLLILLELMHRSKGRATGDHLCVVMIGNRETKMFREMNPDNKVLLPASQQMPSCASMRQADHWWSAQTGAYKTVWQESNSAPHYSPCFQSDCKASKGTGQDLDSNTSSVCFCALLTCNRGAIQCTTCKDPIFGTADNCSHLVGLRVPLIERVVAALRLCTTQQHRRESTRSISAWVLLDGPADELMSTAWCRHPVCGTSGTGCGSG